MKRTRRDIAKDLLDEGKDKNYIVNYLNIIEGYGDALGLKPEEIKRILTREERR